MRIREVIISATALAGIAAVVAQVRPRFDDVSTCLTRSQAIGRAFQMYASDNDDRSVLVAYGPDADYQRPDIKVWPELLFPYHGEWKNYRCPASPYATEPMVSEDQSGAPVEDPANKEHYWALNSSHGFNTSYLCPMVQFASGKTLPAPISLQAVEDERKTILSLDTAIGAVQQRPGGAGWYLAGPPCRYDRDGNDTFPIPTNALLRWSISWHPEQTGRESTRFGYVWPWHRATPNGDREQMTAVLFVDGHSKMMRIEQLTSGCDVDTNWKGRIVSTRDYLWDLNQGGNDEQH